MSTFGVAVPLLLFFWKQCRTKHCFRKFHRVDRPVRAANIAFDHLQHAGTTEALEHLGRIVLVTHLRQRQRVTETPAHVERQRH